MHWAWRPGACVQSYLSPIRTMDYDRLKLPVWHDHDLQLVKGVFKALLHVQGTAACSGIAA